MRGRYENPLTAGPIVLVAAVGGAEGARAAAAALVCAGPGEEAGLLVDLGGRVPRPTLIATDAARRLEERLTAHLPRERAASRGGACHLVATADEQGLAVASAAVAVARGAVVAIHLPAGMLPMVLAGVGPAPSAALLRADLGSDRALVALAARSLMAKGLDVAVLKRRLRWVDERRALFGALPAGSLGGIPARIARRLSVEFSTGRDTAPDWGSESGSDSVEAGAAVRTALPVRGRR